MSATQDTAEFTGLRARFFPIHGSEMKKFIPLALIMFCILFNYTVLRDTKDTLVVNATGGSTIIPFLKLWCVTPAAILFVAIYAKLTNVLKRENVFYAVVTPFLIFFGLFGFVIYPNLEMLHPAQETIQALQADYPRMKGFLDIYGYWSFSLFYVLSEIWGSAMIALMFWQFANQVVRLNESKRFYGLFVVIANVALIFSGQAVKFGSTGIRNFLPEGVDSWPVSVKILMALVVIMGISCMMIYRWMHTAVLTDKKYYDPEEAAGKKKKKKSKPGLAESAKIIFTSPELGLIAALIMAYGVTINLLEVQWKEQLGVFFAGDKGAYNAFMGEFSTWTGVVTILFALFVGSSLLRKLSWFKAAVITPTIIVIGGVIFFTFIFAKDAAAELLMKAALSPVAAATFLGFIIVIASKSIKYSLFDPTKEMAYIPLDDELKTKGKAAVDVIGGRAGKSGGAAVQTGLIIAFAAQTASQIVIPAFLVFAVVGVLWMYAVKALSVKVNAAAAIK